MTETSAASSKVREVRARNWARRQGLVLRRSRRRDPGALSFGTYQLTDYMTGLIVLGGSEAEDYFGQTLDQIETFLRGGPVAELEPTEITVSGLTAVLQYVRGYPVGLRRRNGWLLESAGEPPRVEFMEATVEDRDEVAEHALAIVAIWSQGGR